MRSADSKTPQNALQPNLKAQDWFQSRPNILFGDTSCYRVQRPLFPVTACTSWTQDYYKTLEIRLELKLNHASPELSITSPIRIDMTLRRAQDRFHQPCIFVWNISRAFARAQFVLLHAKGDVLEHVNVSQQSIGKEQRDEEDVMKVHGYNHGLEQLLSGSSERSVQTLPANYHKTLILGQNYITLARRGGFYFTMVGSEPWPGRAECEAKLGFVLANQKDEEWRREQSPPPHLDPFPRLNENE
ncbi:hypothetical protein V8E51_005353 [Hyaloscypha variabilis]